MSEERFNDVSNEDILRQLMRIRFYLFATFVSSGITLGFVTALILTR